TEIEGDIQSRQRRPQFMRDIGSELTLPRNEFLDSGSHCIEIANKIPNLVPALCKFGASPDAQITRGKPLRHFPEPQNRSGDIAGEKRTNQSGDEEGNAPLQNNRSPVDTKSGTRAGRK